MTTDIAHPPRARLGLLLWAAGMLGAVTITAILLPQLSRNVAVPAPLPAPLWAISLASLAQSAVLLALAVWAGVVFAPAVGLRAPVFEAMTMRRAVTPALRQQLVPGLVAGILGGGLLFATVRFAPAALVDMQEWINVPLFARVLYGGITEELLLRWGLMTTLVWLTWRFLQHRRGPPQTNYVWLAIVVSALVFGAGHLPVAAALIGELQADVVAFVVGANTAFGLLFGYLFWRSGLEAAMIAHALAHVVNHLLTLA